MGILLVAPTHYGQPRVENFYLACQWCISHALKPKDLRRRPNFFVGIAASFLQ